MSEKIEKIAPNSISNLNYTIEKNSGEKYNITSNVFSISIFESIFKYFIHAEMVIFDTSSLIDTIPILGKEKLIMRFSKGDIDYEMEFYINGITEKNEMSEYASTYSLYLSVKEEMLNGLKVFSKAYKGTHTEIVNKIFLDSFNISIEDLDQSYGTINYIVPMKKPISAIKDILTTAHEENGTPFFIYQTLNGDGKYHCKSLFNLLSTDKIIKLDYGTFGSITGDSLRELQKHQFRLNELRFRKGFDTYNNISDGAYSSNINVIDLNRKTYNNLQFSKNKNANITINGIDFISNTTYDSLDSSINFSNSYESKSSIYYVNQKHFNKNYNLYGTNGLTKAIHSSYITRLDTQVATGFGNSIPHVQSGSKVHIRFIKSVETHSDNPDTYHDEVLSGIYLVTSIRHMIKDGIYTMSYEFMREGITEEQDSRLINYTNITRTKK